jgi:hypothetical protein
MSKTKNPPVLFMRIAWMDNYKGKTAEDIPRGAGSFVDENEVGGEIYNFLKTGNSYYGFVRVGKGGKIDIKKLGALKDAELLTGVTVVFFSKNAPLGGGQYIVGCYKDATVYKDVQHLVDGKTRRAYNVKCNFKNSILIPSELRHKSIEGPGQSNLFYAHNYLKNREIGEILDFIYNPKALKLKSTSNRNGGNSRGWVMDAEERKRIEIAAMDFTAEYYENRGFKVEDVCRQNLGWDLEAVKGNVKLLLEVKGTKNAFNTIELTPNEYFHFKAKKKSYRLCVVEYALDKKNIDIDIIHHNGKKWVNLKGKDITKTEVTSAKICLK